MEFRPIRVDSISTRTDETVRFPMVGLLNSDYLIRDQDDQEAGKARVEDGVIVVFALRSDLEDPDRDKIRDMLLRSIAVDADNMNANLSIELTATDFDMMTLKRFFERWGFRTTSGTIMKRNAGSSRPPSLAETVRL